MNLDMSKLEPLLGTVVNELGAASNAALVILGDKLGLFRALAEAEVTSAELAQQDRNERALWCANGCPRRRRPASSLTTRTRTRSRCRPSRPRCSRIEDSPVAMAGAFGLLSAVYHDEPKLAEAFKTGKGLHWGEHCNCLFCGVERFFRPGYRANLVAEWLPALDGVVEKLERGAKVADVGCGHGVSTLLMAEAFPKSAVHRHRLSRRLDRACQEADQRHEERPLRGRQGAGLRRATATTSSRCSTHCTTWAIRSARIRHIRKALKDDGTLDAGRAGGGRQPGGQSQSGRTRLLCGLDPHVRADLAQSGGRAWRSARRPARSGSARSCEQGGFSRVRKAAATPFNMVLEARRVSRHRGRGHPRSKMKQEKTEDDQRYPLGA